MGRQHQMNIQLIKQQRPQSFKERLYVCIFDPIEGGHAVALHHPRNIEIWDIFGEDHVLYASDWPNSDHHATYEETISIVRNYVEPKGRKVSEKFFWKNSVVAYRWHRRQPDQPA